MVNISVNIKDYSFFYHHCRTCLLILETGERRGREREKHQSIAFPTCPRPEISGSRPDQGPNPYLGRCPDQNQTHNLSVYRMTLQPSDPHWPGQQTLLLLRSEKDGGWFKPNTKLSHGVFNICKHHVKTTITQRGWRIKKSM